MIAQYFQNQLALTLELTPEILERIVYKLVWSGKRMEPGDRVLTAFVYQKGTNNLKAITFLERELHELDVQFKYLGFAEDEITPIIAFKDDPKPRNNP